MAEVVRDDQLPAGAGTAKEVAAVPAASVLLLRDGPLEVLMIRRHAKSSFIPDAWVFPGGGAEEEDYTLGPESIVNAMRVTAARELYEETGIYLGSNGALASAGPIDQPDRLKPVLHFHDLYAQSPIDLEQLVWTSRWITPVGVPRRFDTYFFLACGPRERELRLQASEAVDSIWISPGEAVERHLANDFPIVFPTLKNLEAIVGYGTAEELLESRRNIEIPTTRPILLVEGGQKKIVLP